MAPKKPSRDELLASCAEVDADDGLDPRTAFRARPPRVPNRKALQLCSQIADTLTVVLAGCGDDVLRELSVQSVLPAMTSVRLLVTLTLPSNAEVTNALAFSRLEGAAGLLRTEIARAINRKKVPELLYRLESGATGADEGGQ